jgi:phosphoglycolate phosphatase-like HAD superfamily hydrolase
VKPIVAVDIDGTIGDHYSHLIAFAELWLGHPIKYDPAAGWSNGVNKFQFNRALGVSKATYRKIKLAYRLGGMKRSMPVFDGASELTQGLRRAGVEVWICTSRPYLKMDTMDNDTRHWLRINHIRHDHLLYGDRKYGDLARQVGVDNVVVVLDDLTEMYAQAERAGLEALLIERPHNEHRPARPILRSVDSLWQAQDRIVEMVKRAK